MSTYPNGPIRVNAFRARGGPLDYSTDQGVTLAQFFNSVYAWMCLGLAVTALTAFGTATFGLHTPLISPLAMIVLFVVEIGLVMAISGALERISAPVAAALFLTYAALNGVSLSVLFLVYAHSTLAGVFIITAGLFGAMSVYGYVTKADLTRFGSLLLMGLIGVVIASVVNLFLHSTALQWIVSYLGVAVFLGLTAYDTQMLKQVGLQANDNPALARRLAVVGSLRLYLDFINLFILLLQIFGNRRSN